jgi:glycosyltransferase involved in cell wall biosynthesis
VLVGRVDDDTLRAAYHLCDLFIMPNIPVQHDIEGFGLVALEAAAAGRYVVASRLDGIPEAIVPGQNGILLDPLDSEAFASTILELLADDEQRAMLGRKARKFVEGHYSWDIVAKRYQALFMRVIHDNHDHSHGRSQGQHAQPGNKPARQSESEPQEASSLSEE